MRRSVNKNIAKPLQNVLSGKQRLWQVCQLSTQSDFNNQHRQDADCIENRKAEKWTFDIPPNKQTTGDPETFVSGAQPATDIRSDIHKDFVRGTLYYDREADTLHCYSVCNNNHRVISYHTSTTNENEFKDSGDSTDYKVSQTNKEDEQSVADSKTIKCENSAAQASTLNEYDQRLKNFTDGVLGKIKQGSYVNDPRFTYKPLNINDNDTKAATSDKKYNSGSENEYVRAILNGIPSKQITTYTPFNSASRSQSKNTLENDNNFKKIEASQNKQTKDVQPEFSDVSLKSHQHGNESSTKESDERKTYLELCKNNSQQRFKKNLAKRLNADHSKSTRTQYKDTYKDNTSTGRMKFKLKRLDDEFRSPSYSLRNGFEEKDILKCKSHSTDHGDQMYYSQVEPLKNNSLKNQPTHSGRKYLSHSTSQETYSFGKVEMECSANRQNNRSTSEIKNIYKDKNHINHNPSKLKDILSNKTDKKNINLSKSNEKCVSNVSKNNFDGMLYEIKGINTSNKSMSKELLPLSYSEPTANKVATNKINLKEKVNISQDFKLPLTQSLTDSFRQINKDKIKNTEYKLDKDANYLKEIKCDLKDSPKLNDTMSKKIANFEDEKSIKINKSDTTTKSKSYLSKKINLENDPNLINKQQLKCDNAEANFKSHFNEPFKPSKLKVKSLEPNKSFKLKTKEKDYQNISEAVGINTQKRQEDNPKTNVQTNIPKTIYKTVSNNKIKPEVSRETTNDTYLKSTTEVNKTLDISKKLKLKDNVKQESENNKDLEKLTPSDEREKNSDISFPGITPLTFCSTVGFENGKQFLVLPKEDIVGAKTVKDDENKVNLKDPEDSSKTKIENNEKTTKLEVANETAKTKSFGDSKENKKIEGGNDIGKLTTKLLNKSENDSTKNTFVTTPFKQEFKIPHEKPIKENLTSLIAQQSQLNNDKITTILKEHKKLLELLLEKVNARQTPHPVDVTSLKERIQETKESEKSNVASNNLNNKKINDNFRKIFHNSSEEKVKRLHPRKKDKSKIPNKVAESKDVDKSDSTGPTPPSTDGRKCELMQRDITPPKDTRLNTYNYKPKPTKLKPFHVVTMMTSPSGQCVPKKSNDPLIDGSKLSKYNYSPLKQILSQYRVDTTMKPIQPIIAQTSKGTIFKPITSKKHKPDNTERKLDWRNFSYTAYLNIRGKHERAKEKSREAISQIKKISLINKKKNYNIKDNFNKRHLTVKAKSQVEVINTLKKIFKHTNKKIKKIEKETKEESENASKPSDEKSMKLSKGVFFDSIKREFHNSSNKHMKPKIILTNYLTNTKPAIINDKIKPKSLNNVKNNITFVTRQNLSNLSFRSGLETKPNIFNVENSKEILEGPSWVVSPEYSKNTNQWNTSPLPLNNALIKMENKNVLSKTNVKPSNTVEILSSLSKNMLLPKFLSTSSKPSLQVSLNVPVLASSAIPISSGMFKYKTYKKNETEMKIEKKINSNINKPPKLFQVDKDYINEHLSTLAEPDSSSVTTVSKKYKLSKIVKSNNEEFRYKPTLFTTEPKTNILKPKPTTNCSAYRVYSRNYLQFSPLKSLASIFSGATPFQNNTAKKADSPENEELKEPCPLPQEGLKIIPKDESKSNIFKISEYLNSKIYLNERFNENIYLPSLLPLKIAWVKMTSKIKNLIKFKFRNENQCCMPNFDEMMVLISKDMEKNGWENITTPKNNKNINLDQLKQTRSKELLLVTDKEKLKVGIGMIKNQTKFPKPPRFVDERIKNY